MSKFCKIGLLVLLSVTTLAGFLWLPPTNNGFLHPKLARIVVFHVPCSLVATVASVVATIFAVLYLKTRDVLHDVRSKVSFELALLFWILTTVTGAVFAKAQWNAYWSWDIKQGCILLLLLILIAYFALRNAIDDPDRKATLGAVYALFAMIAVPYLTYILPNSTQLTEHPKGTLTTSDGLMPQYALVLWAGFVGLTGVYAWLFRLHVKVEMLEHRRMLRESEANKKRTVTTVSRRGEAT